MGEPKIAQRPNIPRKYRQWSKSEIGNKSEKQKITTLAINKKRSLRGTVRFKPWENPVG